MRELVIESATPITNGSVDNDTRPAVWIGDSQALIFGSVSDDTDGQILAVSNLRAALSKVEVELHERKQGLRS